jgi:hypothetical protein
MATMMTQQDSIVDVATRFWKNVDKNAPNGCWEWQGCLNDSGYGILGRGGRKEGNVRAHRLSFEMANGMTLQSHQIVCHKCDNRKCVNPDHLFLGTRKDNNQDMWRKGRGKIRQTHKRGQQNNNAKLDWEKVKEIRRLSAEGYSQRQIGKMFNIDHSQVGHIVKGEQWQDQ